MFKIFLPLMALLFSFNVLAQEQYMPGRDYVVIDKPVPTEDASKVEVTEVFWYGCGHCNNFRPKFAAWKQQQASDVNILHSPAIWSEPMIVHASIYYTAKILGKDKVMHKEIFDAMHQQKKQLVDMGEIYPLFEKHGVSQEEFDKTMRSFSVRTMVNKANQRAREGYKIQGTPEVIVNGKYRISTRLVRTHEKMLEVVDFLVEKERQALAAS